MDADKISTCALLPSESIPAFTRSNPVGYQFAYDVALWLYENYPYFEVDSLEWLKSFLDTDPFNIGLSPAAAKAVRVRGLALRIRVEKTIDISALLALLTERQIRHGFILDITFQYLPGGVHHLKIALEALHPVVIGLGDTHKAKVNISLAQDRGRPFDIKHMLRPWDFGRWERWTYNELATNGRKQEGHAPAFHTLRIRADIWALLLASTKLRSLT
jgi:hypothetical protein